MIIIPIKWLFHWGYTPFSDIPKCWCVLCSPPCCVRGGVLKWVGFILSSVVQLSFLIMIPGRFWNIRPLLSEYLPEKLLHVSWNRQLGQNPWVQGENMNQSHWWRRRKAPKAKNSETFRKQTALPSQTLSWGSARGLDSSGALEGGELFVLLQILSIDASYQVGESWWKLVKAGESRWEWEWVRVTTSWCLWNNLSPGSVWDTQSSPWSSARDAVRRPQARNFRHRLSKPGWASDALNCSASSLGSQDLASEVCLAGKHVPICANYIQLDKSWMPVWPRNSCFPAFCLEPRAGRFLLRFDK